MDNHLAAGWAWLRQINSNDSHYLLHIDRHYDLLDSPKTVQSQIIAKGIDLKSQTLDEYLSLRQIGTNGDSWPLFRWDNYILNLRIVYPNIYAKTFFATFKDGNIDEDFVDEEMDFWELMTEIDYMIENKTDYKWIVNLDIDYFFNNVNDKKIQVITNDVIRKVLDKISVFTICLSPECCGGWEKSLSKLEIICEVLEIDFLKELRKKTKHNNTPTPPFLPKVNG